MTFASTQLAARIERVECGLLRDCARAVASRRHGHRVLAREIAGGVATFTESDSPLNKVAGLGFAGPIPIDELQALERELAERGADVRVELSCLAEPSIGTLLTERGYVLTGFENVLGRALPFDAQPSSDAGIEIVRCSAEDRATWLDVVVTGFATPDTQGVPPDESFPRDVLERVVEDMACASGFTRYLARCAGDPAGAASMRLCDGVAQLCGAATLPAHRRRGVQGRLLMTRLAEATRAGCDIAVVTTQPGSKSAENVQRQGFELLYTRAVLVLRTSGRDAR